MGIIRLGVPQASVGISFMMQQLWTLRRSKGHWTQWSMGTLAVAEALSVAEALEATITNIAVCNGQLR